MSLPSRLTLIYAILLFSAPVTTFAGTICENLAQQNVNKEALRLLDCGPGNTTPPTVVPQTPSVVEPNDIKFAVLTGINKQEQYVTTVDEKHAVVVSAPKLLEEAEAGTYEEEMGEKGDGGLWDDSEDSGGASAVVD